MKENIVQRVGQVEKEQNIKDEVINEVTNAEEVKEELREGNSIVDEELKAKLEEKEKQYDDLKDRLQRTMAEFDNFRKRTAKEKAALYEDSVRSTIEQILPVIDNFERALSSGEKEDKNNPFLQGMEMVYRQFKDILTSMGVEEINAVGEKFDPNLHNAVTHIEDEAFGESEVVEEFQKGYVFKDKVIRYSMVKVAN